MKKLKIIVALTKTLRKKIREAISKFIIHERLPMRLSQFPWMHNLINAAVEIGTTGIKFPTPYEFFDVYLNLNINL